MQYLYPGIWKITLGTPEAVTPMTVRHYSPAAEALSCLPPAACPFAEGAITGHGARRGYQLAIALSAEEQLYGFGLQLLSFNQRGVKKTLRVNSDPKADLGDSHAPAPFYLSTAGYGIFIDTARYATFYTGCAHPVGEDPLRSRAGSAVPLEELSLSPETLYSTRGTGGDDRVLVEIPCAAGVDVYLFAGASMSDALQRYILFSGGGCLPPRWGLGPWYRCRGDFDQQQVLELAATFRREQIPCDVIGLEPGWQSHSYSCSFLWDKKFPDPEAMLGALAAQHYQVNLWTHLFTHPSSPVYPALRRYAGDYQVWGGLAPDLVQPEARQLIAEHFTRAHVAIGVSGYKVDECDNSDFISTPWSYPELSTFPSGVDGEQMHSLMGMQCMEMVDGIYRARNQRAYHEVRSAGALASPYPFVLYSDLYRHKDFIRGVVNSGFSGLLWCPEVRDAGSAEELLRRLQTVIFSPQALVNGWYITHAPWKQWETDANNAGRFADDWPQVEEACRTLLRLRMALIPYLYAAFFRYAAEGMPPFRALVLDYPEDERVWHIDDQYLVGDRLLAAPVVAGESARTLYLPAGEWFDFWNGARYAGGQSITLAVPLEHIPVFVKGGAVLPLATPALHSADVAGYTLTARIYGDGALPITLIEDDGVSYAYQDGQLNRCTLAWDHATRSGSLQRSGTCACPGYSVNAWEAM